MSTRSRANPWFRPVVPIADAYVNGVMADAHLEMSFRPTLDPPRPEAEGAAITRMLIRARLDNKLVLTARMLDPTFDAKVRAVCPELPELNSNASTSVESE